MNRLSYTRRIRQISRGMYFQTDSVQVSVIMVVTEVHSCGYEILFSVEDSTTRLSLSVLQDFHRTSSEQQTGNTDPGL